MAACRVECRLRLYMPRAVRTPEAAPTFPAPRFFHAGKVWPPTDVFIATGRPPWAEQQDDEAQPRIHHVPIRPRPPRRVVDCPIPDFGRRPARRGLRRQ